MRATRTMVSYAELFQDPIEISDEVYKDNMCRQVKHLFEIEPSAYNTEELEVIVDKVIDFDEYFIQIGIPTQVVSVGHNDLWICKQMYLFNGMIDWNYYDMEVIDNLYEIHEGIRKALEV